MTAERGADVAAVVKAVLAEFPMSEDGTGHIIDAALAAVAERLGVAT